MSKKSDLIFLKVMHNVLHSIFILIFAWHLVDHVRHYQADDHRLRLFLLENRDRCMNITVMIEHVLDKKNNLTEVFMFHLVYLLATSLSLVLVIANAMVILFIYNILLTLVLLASLVLPNLLPSLFTVAIFITCVSLNYCFICVYLRPTRRPKVLTLSSPNQHQHQHVTMDPYPEPTMPASFMHPSLESFSISEDL